MYSNKAITFQESVNFYSRLTSLSDDVTNCIKFGKKFKKIRILKIIKKKEKKKKNIFISLNRRGCEIYF